MGLLSGLQSSHSSPPQPHLPLVRLCHHRAGRCAFISPCRRQNANGLVVAAEAVDAGFDEDQAEFGVLVFAVALEVLADGDGLEHGNIELESTPMDIFLPQDIGKTAWQTWKEGAVPS